MQVKKLLSLETCQECICLSETMNFNFIRTEMDICFDYDCYKLVWFQVKLVTLTKHINVMLDKIYYVNVEHTFVVLSRLRG